MRGAFPRRGRRGLDSHIHEPKSWRPRLQWLAKRSRAWWVVCVGGAFYFILLMLLMTLHYRYNSLFKI